ncbi:MAG: fumarylacetoacetate hydrolase family protein [Pseudomonadota bacterium]
MKLISTLRMGQTGWAAILGNGILNLTGFKDAETLKEALEIGVLPELGAVLETAKPDLHMSDMTLLPVIPDPGKILCIGLNYQKHKQETGRPDVDNPTVFTRFADSQVAHLAPLIKPVVSDRFDYEGEMAVVIGKGGRAISEEDALSHVAGYACYNDGSVRDWQRHTMQFTPGKTFPGTGAFGPCLVTTDQVGDYRKLPIQTRLNGEVVQDASLADLIFPVERLIAYCSTFTPLAAGDVILSGTPGGVGDKREPPLYMTDGDRVEVEIGMLGTLVNPVVDESKL